MSLPRYGATHPVPVEALLAEDYELTLAWAPLVDTDECCRFEACESEQFCTCQEEVEE